MKRYGPHTKWMTAERLVLLILLLELIILLISGAGLSGYAHSPFFSIETDPVYWAFFITGIPQYIVQHSWLGLLLNSTIIIFLLLLIQKPGRSHIARILFVWLLLFYITLTGYLGHRNYQSGFVWLLFPFLFTKAVNKKFAYEAIRYFMLFFYVSAAALKISNDLFYSPGQFSNFLTGQFAPYYLEGNTGWRTSLNTFLIAHENYAAGLYVVSVLIELTALVGFFTKKWDRWLAISILSFHLVSWAIMDIAPIGQIGFIALLFLGRELLANWTTTQIKTS